MKAQTDVQSVHAMVCGPGLRVFADDRLLMLGGRFLAGGLCGRRERARKKHAKNACESGDGVGFGASNVGRRQVGPYIFRTIVGGFCSLRFVCSPVFAFSAD